MTEEGRETHWNDVYRTKGDSDVSWFEEVPRLSLDLIREHAQPTSAIIDIGGGASRLPDALLGAAFTDVTVLDISAEALAKARARVAAMGGEAHWIVSDVTKWRPARAYDVWHDRAAFHFLTSAEDQAAYRQVLEKALRSGGTAIIATFAPDGPEKCSGLPVARHDGSSIAAVLGSGFSLQRELRHEHHTPWGSVQKFQFSVFRKT
jgi:SAM-dependent methyltransferase